MAVGIRPAPGWISVFIPVPFWSPEGRAAEGMSPRAIVLLSVLLARSLPCLQTVFIIPCSLRPIN